MPAEASKARASRPSAASMSAMPLTQTAEVVRLVTFALPEASVGPMGSLNWPPRLLTCDVLTSSVAAAPIRVKITGAIANGTCHGIAACAKEPLWADDKGD